MTGAQSLLLVSGYHYASDLLISNKQPMFIAEPEHASIVRPAFHDAGCRGMLPHDQPKGYGLEMECD